MINKKTISTGFRATKGPKSFELKIEVFELGFYLITYENGILVDQTTRNTLKKVQNILEKELHSFTKRGYEIKHLPEVAIMVENGYFRIANKPLKK